MTAGIPAAPDAFNGVLIVDKPAGFTSFDVVAVLRGLTRQKKIGHTGTLDPMATGVLPLLLGTAAKAESLLPDTDKAYEADFQLGVETDTQDSTGAVLRESGSPASRGQVESLSGGAYAAAPHVLGGAPKRTAALRAGPGGQGGGTPAAPGGYP